MILWCQFVLNLKWMDTSYVIHSPGICMVSDRLNTTNVILILFHAETLITPEQFAEIMCEDLQLPPSTFVPLISRGIHDQLEDYYLNAGSAVMDGDGSDVEKETAEFLAQCKESSNFVVKVDKEEDLEQRKRKHTELRMLIKVKVSDILYIQRG